MSTPVFNFPVAEFCRLCQRVKDGELDVLNRESREMITTIVYGAAEHLGDALSLESMSEMLRQGASEKPTTPQTNHHDHQAGAEALVAKVARNADRLASVLRPRPGHNSNHSLANTGSSASPSNGGSQCLDQVPQSALAQPSESPKAAAESGDKVVLDHPEGASASQSKALPAYPPAPVSVPRESDSNLPSSDVAALTPVGKGAQDIALKSATSSPDSITLDPPPSTPNG